jgi:methyl-accepting chemotaxis protein
MGDAARSMADLAEGLKSSTNAQKVRGGTGGLGGGTVGQRRRGEGLGFAQIAAALDQIQKAAGIQGKAAEKSSDLGAQLLQAAKGMNERATASARRR